MIIQKLKKNIKRSKSSSIGIAGSKEALKKGYVVLSDSFMRSSRDEKVRPVGMKRQKLEKSIGMMCCGHTRCQYVFMRL